MDYRAARKFFLLGLAFAAAFAQGRPPSARSQEALQASARKAFASAAGSVAVPNTPVPSAGQPAAVPLPQTSVANWDLHTHTYYSDGILSPEELVRQAAKAGVKYLAVTDHDSMEALPRAAKEAAAQGIVFIPGIEVSAEDDGLHILGLGIDPNHADLRSLVDAAKSERVDRAKKILAALEKLQDPATQRPIKIDLVRDILLPRLNLQRQADGEPPLTADQAGALREEEALKRLKGQITRPDIARALVAKGYAASNKEAFAKYLGDQAPAGVPMAGPPFQKVIDAIHKAGGIAVLAHPYTVFKFKKFPLDYHGTKYPDFEALAAALLKAGLDGFEQYRPGAAQYPQDNARVEKIVSGHLQQNPGSKLLLSGGSDYHGGAASGIGPGAVGGADMPTAAADELGRRLAPASAPKPQGASPASPRP